MPNKDIAGNASIIDNINTNFLPLFNTPLYPYTDRSLAASFFWWDCSQSKSIVSISVRERASNESLFQSLASAGHWNRWTSFVIVIILCSFLGISGRSSRGWSLEWDCHLNSHVDKHEQPSSPSFSTTKLRGIETSSHGSIKTRK